MKHTSADKTTARASIDSAHSEASAGPNGIALAPPSYSLDVLHHTLGETVREPFQVPVAHAPIQMKTGASAGSDAGERPANRTGMPAILKAGVEHLSGFAMDDVRVHYNSPRPAQLQALAYTQGTEIHVGPGQERHLPHEAWHVVQQKQGRVQPTLQMKGTHINDDQGLEQEATRLGGLATRVGGNVVAQAGSETSHVTHRPQTGGDIPNQNKGTVQRAVGFELEVNIPVSQQVLPDDGMAANARPAASDWANARTPFPEADPHAAIPVPQTMIYKHANGVDAVPDKRRLAVGMPTQILEIRVDPIDTINIGGLVATMANIKAGIDPLYNGVNAANPADNRFPIPIQGPAALAMVGLPNKDDPLGEFDNADRGLVDWTTYMQATAGVRSDRLRRMSKKIQHGAQGMDDPSLSSLRSPIKRHRDIARDARARAQQTYTKVHGEAPNPEHGMPAEKKAVLGFLTLICMYLIGGSKAYAGQGNKNPKNMAAVFSRSGFDTIRANTLSANSDQWIRDNWKLLRNELVKRTREKKADGLITSVFNRQMNHPTVPVNVFLHDVLSDMMDQYTASESKSIIAPEHVGAARPGAVLEFRNIAAPGNTPTAWIAKMTEVITAIHHLNA